MPTIMTPTELDMSGGLRAMVDLEKVRKKDMQGPDKADDHPHITEIRDRLVDLIHEMDDLKMFD